MKIKKLFLGALVFAITAIICALTAGAEKSGDYQIQVTGENTAAIISYSGSATNLTIPSTLNGMKITLINDDAFYANTKLKSVTIPNTVVSIGNHAFGECTSLSSVTIPSSVKRIGTEAFEKTPLLTKQSTSARYVGKWLISSDKSELSVKSGTIGIADGACTFGEITKLTLPSGLKYIGALSFTYCESLYEVNIPSSVEYIGQLAFYGTDAASYQLMFSDVAYIDKWVVDCSEDISGTVSIDAGTVGIADYVFNGMNVSAVKLPSSLKIIGEGAFMDTLISSVSIPAGVTTVGAGAFGSCSNLKTITVSASNNNYSALNGVFYNKNKTKLLQYPCAKTDKTFTVPSTVTEIDGVAFMLAEKLTSVTFPSSLKSIGDGAFGFASSLTSLKLPSSVKYIGTLAFVDCTSLNSVTLSSNLRDIGSMAFLGCSKLTKITIPKNVKNIMPYALGYCYKNNDLSDVYLKSGFTISGYDGEAKRYANENNIKYVKLTDNSVSAVSGFKCSSKTSTSVSLQWTKNSSASGYELQQYKDGKWVTVATPSTSTTSYTIKGLKAGTAGYRFRIRAYKTSGTSKKYSSWSSEVKVNTNPYGVGGFSVKSKFSVSVTLQWNKGTTASGYQLQQYKDGKWVTIYTANKATITSYTVKNLKAGTAGYQFRIRAYKTYGSTKQYGSWSNVIKVNTNPYGVGGFKAKSSTKNSVTLQWNKGTTASGYVIEKWDGSKWVHVARITNANTTAYTVKGLKSNTSYQFKIRAFKSYSTGNQYGTWSTPLTVKTK